MTKHSKDTIEKVRKLRIEGKSLDEIWKIVPEVKSQGTISVWTRDIKLSDDVRKELNSRGGKKTSAGRIQKYWKDKTEKYLSVWRDKFSDIKLDESTLAIVGAVLYWGEGSKFKNSFSLANTDQFMVSMYMRWLRESLEVKDEDIVCSVSVRLNNGLSEDDVIKYWSDIVNIPISQFRKYPSNIVTRKSSGKKKNVWEYGVITIKVKHSRKYRSALSVLWGKIGKIDEFGTMV